MEKNGQRKVRAITNGVVFRGDQDPPDTRGEEAK